MHAHADEVLRAGLFVEADQVVRVELVAPPGGDDVFESELAGMPIGRDVILVLLAALHVHVAGVPVAGFGGRLRTPVGPDAELGIAEPFGNLVLPQRFTCGFKRSGGFGEDGRGETSRKQAEGVSAGERHVPGDARLWAAARNRAAWNRPCSRFSASP